MINLMIKNIFENSNKIDIIVKHINKTNKINCFKFLVVSASICAVMNKIEKQDKEINNLKTEIEELKSKGV